MKRKYLDREKLQAIKSELDQSADFAETAAEPPLTVEKECFLSAMRLLKKKYKFDMLSNLTAVDYPDSFEVVYNLVNRTNYEELTVKVMLDKQAPQIESLTKIWPEADFQEREQYDLMGIIFLNHAGLKRILLPDDFAGYPLRKDYRQAAEGAEKNDKN